MTSISDEYLEKLFKEAKTETESSHLILPSSKVDRICQLKKFNKFLLMDLRNNDILNTINFTNLSSLRFLYLQNNEISKIQGFRSLTNLECLFLDYNKIDVIEDLELCPLKKLSVKAQRLSAENHLLFDVRTMSGLSYRLTALNVSRNGLSSLGPLRYLKLLEDLDASGNKLASSRAVEEGLQGSQGCLTALELLGNPLLKGRGAAIRLIATLPRLQRLNGTEVREETRAACRHIQSVGGTGEDSPTASGKKALGTDIADPFKHKDVLREPRNKENIEQPKMKSFKNK